jgi:hypothetical protein
LNFLTDAVESFRLSAPIDAGYLKPHQSLEVEFAVLGADTSAGRAKIIV